MLSQYDTFVGMNTLVKETLSGVKGKRSWGTNILPLEGNLNICKGTGWDAKGYVIDDFLTEEEYTLFYEGVRKMYIEVMNSLGVTVPNNFVLEDYHKYASKIHYDVVQKVQHIPVEKFPIDLNIVLNRISKICGKQLCCLNPDTNEQLFNFRTTRPQQPDYNPIHRDTWHPEYENCVNIYVGLAGSDENSSLPVEPGSHFWNENEVEWTDEGALFNGVQFTVPGVTDCLNELTMLRPNPKRNEVMVFSPYTIHGGASNLNKDRTRISLEMRFWIK